MKKEEERNYEMRHLMVSGYVCLLFVISRSSSEKKKKKEGKLFIIRPMNERVNVHRRMNRAESFEK